MRKKQILIIDDSYDLTRVLRTGIETLGMPMEVRVVPSAEEALLEILKGTTDLIITDIHLPGISGLELLPKIRKFNKSVNIIMMTGLTDIQLEDEARKAGANFFLRKPIEMSLFLDAVGSFLGINNSPEDEEDSKDSTGLPVFSVNEEEFKATNFSETLASLRKEINASVIWVLDVDGHIALQSGNSQDIQFEERWVPLLMPVLSTSEKFTKAFYYNEMPQSITTFRLDNIEVLLMPVGDYALVILLNKGRGTLRLPIAIDQVLTVQKELSEILKQIGVQPAVEIAEAVRKGTRELDPEKVLEVEADDGIEAEEDVAFESLFDENVPAEDADSFWEVATLRQEYDLKNPDDLSYDQASQLGLAPKEDND
jgi:FixJ family two-component response regulator